MVAKFADHLPLYRQEKIFGRAGLAIARSTLAQWVGQTGMRLQPLVDALREAVLSQGVIHADETPVQMLAPGEKKTHRAYVWAYSNTPFSALKAVVYDFNPSRAGDMHATSWATGTASWFAMTSLATKVVLSKASLKSAAWLTPVASFSICTWRTKVSWPNKRCTRSAACTRSSAKRGT
ncbi:Transposase IS66 family protein [compost metagenome]